MKIAFYGSSLLSAYWNGAATYYRGIIRALADRGWDVTFYEPDVYDRQKHRDMDPPAWCRVVVYPGTAEGLIRAAERAREADIVVKTSGVGFADDALLAAVLANAAPHALKVFWDVDAPATLAELRTAPEHPLRASLDRIDIVLTYGGGPPVVAGYRGFGARDCLPVYNALDPATHHPVPREAGFAADLTFLGNRLPDRESRVERFFLEPAARMPGLSFLLGGAGWQDRAVPPNVRRLGHVPTADHNALNAGAKAVLNINRESMAAIGFSPPTRVFEAAGAGACLITDAWPGLHLFLSTGDEVLVVRDGRDLEELLPRLSPSHAREIGRRALARVMREHTYDRRAEEVDRIFRRLIARRASEVAA